jgi:short subunit dehydrogenase-like uncharacterized protein
MKFLLYGANGYTGQLIARHAKDYGLTPVLSGRNELKIKPLAEELGCEYLVLDLHDAEKLDEALHDFEVVLHAAGPFFLTARPMMEACLRTGTHYLDITGEISVFEMAHRLGNEANSALIMLMPGVGFDVVPSDCLALYLKKLLPDATSLKLANAGLRGGISHGTAMTMTRSLGELGAVRQNGKIVRTPIGHKTLYFPAGEKKLFAMTFPWGDVSTAYYSTNIPNIEVYNGIRPSLYRNLKWSRPFNWLLRTNFVKNMVRKRISKMPAGPSDAQRAEGRSFLWGEVRNEKGEVRQAVLETPEGYTLTYLAALLIVKKVLEDNFKTGFQTPAMAYGEDLVLEVPGTRMNQLQAKDFAGSTL